MRAISLLATTICITSASVAHADASFSFVPVEDGAMHLAGTSTVTGSFSDYWNFSLAQPAIGDFSVGNLHIDMPPMSFNTSNLSLALWSGTALAETVQPGSVPLTAPVPAIVQAALPAGKYFVQVNGIGNGAMTGQGVYGFSDRLVMPLPEPESLGLFVAGLGLLRICRRRRIY